MEKLEEVTCLNDFMFNKDINCSMLHASKNFHRSGKYIYYYIIYLFISLYSLHRLSKEISVGYQCLN